MLFDCEKMGTFLKRHDMIFEKPASRWEQGIPMGNGVLGAVVWGGGDKPLRLSLDRADIWEVRNVSTDPKTFNWKTFTNYLKTEDKEHIDAFIGPEPGKPYPTRFPVGRLEAVFQGETISHTMRLHLHDAVTTGRTVTNCGVVEWRTWVAATRDLVVLETRCEGGERVSVTPKFLPRPGDYSLKDTTESTRWKAYSYRSTQRQPHTVTEMLQEWGYPPCQEGQEEGVSWWCQSIPENGSYSVAWKTLSLGPGHQMFLLTIACDRNSSASRPQAVKLLRGVNTADIAALFDEHRAWWKRYYEASFFSIPDTKLESLYYIELYKLASSTHPGGLHMTLQGPWSEDDNLPAYCSNDYHWNLEQEMQLWPIYTANRLEFGLPMYDMIDRCRPQLARFCRDFFGREGEFLAHCTDLDCKPLLCNVDNFEFNGLPWVCFMYWQHYLYSMDEGFLRERAYPLMREALRPLLQELTEGEDGYLHLPWTSSPEYHSPQETYRWVRHDSPDWVHRFGPDATIDLALVRFLCRALIQAADILKADDSERPAWENCLARLAPYPRDEFGGFAVRAGLPLTTSHRHQSHLFPIYPLHEYTYEKDSELIDNCMLVLGIHGHGEWTGWSFPWVSLLCAYGGRPALARNLLLDYADRYVTESAFHYQGPQFGSDLSLYGTPGGTFSQTIEAGFGAVAALQELALQSNGGVIRLFESAPPAWADLALWNFRTEGAFLISAVRKDCKTRFVHIRAEAGGTAMIRANWEEGTVCVERNDGLEQLPVTDGTVALEMQSGEEALLWQGLQRPAVEITPLSGIPADRNYYGVKRISRF